MKLALAGINHNTAPLAIRELLAFRFEEIPLALLDLQAHGVAEAVILSTCNRVEVTAFLSDDCTEEELLAALVRNGKKEAGGSSGLTVEGLRPHVYFHREQEAIRHIFRVAASLDSMIVGEPQILGQLKQAYAQSRDNGAIGSLLDAVLMRAFHVAKRIRTETEIGQSAVSVSFAAVELAREIFGSLNKKRVLIVGAGKMSEGTGRHLLRSGVSSIAITNRTPARADELARLVGGETIPYDLFPQRLAEMDIVITSSAAPGYILNEDMIRAALDTRKNQPMFLIDIAVPRNIDPAVNALEHAFLYDMDDLAGIATRNLKGRREVALQAERIVNEEVERLQGSLRAREIVPTIQSFQAQLESIRAEVLARYRPRLSGFTPDQTELLETITRSIINKVAHGPISEMRKHAASLPDGHEEPSEGELVSAVRRMFRLGDRDRSRDI